MPNAARDCLRGDSHLCPRGLEHAFGEPYADSADGAVWPSMGAGTLAEQTAGAGRGGRGG